MLIKEHAGLRSHALTSQHADYSAASCITFKIRFVFSFAQKSFGNLLLPPVENKYSSIVYTKIRFCACASSTG